jgi:hypothetical protein
MLSEDTGTQGSGNFELELGYDWMRAPNEHTFLFQPQLSWGASPALDLIIQPSWIDDRTPGQRDSGLGDTNLDVKWRFYGTAPWSLGIRTGLQLPTAHADLGLPHGKVSPHGILVATGDYKPFTFDLNAGYSRAPPDGGLRTNLYHFSAAATVESRERLYFILDVSVDSNPDRTHAYQSVALLGVIYTVRPGLDVDIGYRGRLDAAGPVQQYLLGITVRGAP